MNRKGMTLVEILVASMIMALTMAGLAGVFVAGKRLTLQAQGKTTGGELGRHFLEPLNLDCIYGRGGNPAVCPADGAVFWDDPVRPGMRYSASYERSNVPVGTGPGLTKIKVDISWPRVE